MQTCFEQMKKQNTSANLKNLAKNKSYKEEPTGNFKLKNVTTKTKSSVDGIDRRIKKTKEGIGELGDSTLEITQSEQQRKNRLKKQSTTSWTYGTITKISTIYINKVLE